MDTILLILGVGCFIASLDFFHEGKNQKIKFMFNAQANIFIITFCMLAVSPTLAIFVFFGLNYCLLIYKLNHKNTEEHNENNNDELPDIKTNKCKIDAQQNRLTKENNDSVSKSKNNKTTKQTESNNVNKKNPEVVIKKPEENNKLVKNAATKKTLNNSSKEKMNEQLVGKLRNRTNDVQKIPKSVKKG